MLHALNKQKLKRFMEGAASPNLSLVYKPDWQWSYTNNHDFSFVLNLGFEFSTFSVLIQPSLDIFHTGLAFYYCEMRKAIGKQSGKLYPGAPKFLFDTVSYTDKIPPKNCSSTDEVIEHSKLYFTDFQEEVLKCLCKIDDANALLDYMRGRNLLFGPKGLVTEMILEKFVLNKQEFDEAYRGKGAEMHQSYFRAILDTY